MNFVIEDNYKWIEDGREILELSESYEIIIITHHMNTHSGIIYRTIVLDKTVSISTVFVPSN